MLLHRRTCAVSHSVRWCFRYYRRVIPRVTKTLLRFDRRVWLLLFAMLAFRFGHGLYFPFSSIYFHNVLGIPLSLVGTGLAVFAAVSVLSGLVAGPLTDRYGRKPVMLTALAGSAASFFAFASGSPTASAPSWLARCSRRVFRP